MKRFLLTIILLAIFIPVMADIPQTMNYQGVLTDAGGQPVPDGTYDLTFRIYAVASGGTVLWVETRSVWVTGGRFSVILGRVNPLAIPFDRPYWLGVSIEGGTELTPRREIAASPYSLNSRLADGAVTSGKIADGAVTLSKISKTGASSGQVIQYDGSDITWGTPSGSGGGLELPFSGTVSSSGSAFSIENTGNAIAAYSVHSSAFYGESENSANGMVAVYGVASSPSNDSISFAMLGENDGIGYYSIGSSGIVFGNGVGVYGYAPDEYAIGVWGDTDIGWAGMFSGAVGIEGDLQVTGAIVKGGGGFRIDHPLDPEGKYLNHAFVESSDMMNVYNGNVTLDANGEAWVQLPEWFEALNKDFRYQLTCIGGFAPVYVDRTISGNRFKIAGGRPDLEVSWQVTGIRKDPFAEMQPISVEQTKPAGERGTYLHPRAYGLPKEMGADWAREKREIRKYREALKDKQ